MWIALRRGVCCRTRTSPVTPRFPRAFTPFLSGVRCLSSSVTALRICIQVFESYRPPEVVPVSFRVPCSPILPFIFLCSFIYLHVDQAIPLSYLLPTTSSYRPFLRAIPLHSIMVIVSAWVSAYQYAAWPPLRGNCHHVCMFMNPHPSRVSAPTPSRCVHARTCATKQLDSDDYMYVCEHIFMRPCFHGRI